MQTTAGNEVLGNPWAGSGAGDDLTLPANAVWTQGVPVDSNVLGDPNSGHSATEPVGNGLWWVLLGFVILLAVLKYASEHQKANMQVGPVSIGVWNWTAIGIMAMTFIYVMKLIILQPPLNQIKGLTDIIKGV